MQIIKMWCVILCALPMLVMAAARPDNLEPLEEVKPPPNTLENPNADDAAIEPQITIRKKGAETIEEYRINGELYMMKVTPDHGVSYYLHKEDSQGSWVNDGPNRPLSVPKWILFRF
jgi:Protein of unknown function (DUF2782)